MKLFKASFETLILRYYLLMTLAIVPFFIGAPILALLAVPVFLSALMGISFKSMALTKDNLTHTSRVESQNMRGEFTTA